MSNHTERLNQAQANLKAAALRYGTAQGAGKVTAFNALTEAAQLFLERRKEFRDWLHSVPPPKGARL